MSNSPSPEQLAEELRQAQALLRAMLIFSTLQKQELEEIKAQCEILTNDLFSFESRADMLERRERAHEQRAHLLDLRQERLELRESESA